MPKRKSKPLPPPISLTRDELRRLFERAKTDDPAVYVVMLVHYWHAGRNTEMRELTRDNFSNGFIVYKRLKGSEPCRQQLVAHADPLLNEQKVVSDFLLNLPRNQKFYPRSRWTYWRHLVRLALAAGIPRHKAKTTVLKHSICTHLTEKFDFPTVQRRAGHVNGANTLRYSRVQEEQVDAIVAGAL